MYTFQLNKKMIRKCRLFYLLRNRKNLRIRARIRVQQKTQQLSELKTVQLLCFFYLSLFVDTCHGDIIKLIVNAGIADRIREHGKFVVNVVAGFLHR